MTNDQFVAFVDQGNGYIDDRWWNGLLERQKISASWPTNSGNHPVTNVSWYDATTFCRWLSNRLGFVVRLPDETEWQWAAQSAREHYAYPWGPDWQDRASNTSEAGLGRATAVGMYASSGDSEQGVSDLAGNVWEWCRNEHSDPKRRQAGGGRPRALRGGSWFSDRGFARADARSRDHPHRRSYVVGFRVVCSSPIR